MTPSNPSRGRTPAEALTRLTEMRADGSLKARKARLARPTRGIVRQMCEWCLNLKGNRSGPFDCQVPVCPLYPAHPWKGRPMPTHMLPDTERKAKHAND